MSSYNNEWATGQFKMKTKGKKMGNNNSRQRALNPAEQSVDMAQREQAMKLFHLLAGQHQQYQPIIKSLKQLGIQPLIMDVTVGDEPTECLVIPVAILMRKEWEHMNETPEQENA